MLTQLTGSKLFLSSHARHTLRQNITQFIHKTNILPEESTQIFASLLAYFSVQEEKQVSVFLLTMFGSDSLLRQPLLCPYLSLGSYRSSLSFYDGPKHHH
jgi:hypothetical protein